jgi:zinc protease
LLALATTLGCLLHTLNNGLTVVLLPTQLAPVVAIQAWVGVGSADESPNQAGLSHLMEHMLFKGTARRGVGEIAREVELAGGEINAWTSRDSTVFHLVMPSRYAEVGIDVLSDALIHSSFDADELSREREVVLEEIRQGKDEPMRALAQSMFSGAFERHPYRNPVIGTPESVAKFRRSDLLKFRDRWYRGSNTALVVAGNFEPTKMRRQIQKHFGKLPSGTQPLDGAHALQRNGSPRRR